MLKLLGATYYCLAAILLLMLLVQFANASQTVHYGNGYSPGIIGGFGIFGLFLGSIWCAFFGAICLAADDMKTLLTRIADHGGTAAPTPTP